MLLQAGLLLQILSCVMELKCELYCSMQAPFLQAAYPTTL